VTDRWKLLRFLDLVDPVTGTRVVELYDLEADPDELRSLAGDPQHAQTLAAMTARLEELRRVYRVDAPKVETQPSAPKTP
jgi:arylsulfatase A-like enzyme